MILAIDTETTGLPRRGAKPTEKDYPRPVEIAAIMYDPVTQREVALVSLLVQPEGWTIGESAAAVHGITGVRATECGIPLRVAVAALTNLRRRASAMVGHHIKFDLDILRSALLHLGADPAAILPTSFPVHCTAEMGAPVVNLPPTPAMVTAGINKPKTPKLAELYSFLFGEEIVGAHGALVDARASARCYFEMLGRRAA